MGGHFGGGGSTGFTLPADAADTAHMSGGGDTGTNWKKSLLNMGLGGLGGLSGSLGMAAGNMRQGGAPAQFDTSSPQLSPDVLQPSPYLDDAKRRMQAFYGR